MASSFSKTLRKHPFFSGMESLVFEELESHLQQKVFESGEVICREGQPGDWMFIIETGRVQVLKRTSRHADTQISILHSGDFGGFLCLFDEKPRSATLKALETVSLHILKKDAFHEMVENNGMLAMAMLRFMSKRMTKDSNSLAVVLNYMDQRGVREIYRDSSPQERWMLDSILTKIMATESIGDIMDFLFESLHKLNGSKRLGLCFLEEGGTRIVSYWERADYTPVFIEKGFATDLPGTVLESILKKGKPLAFNNLGTHIEQHGEEGHLAYYYKEGLQSCLACPLLIEDRPIGFLFLGSLRGDGYDTHQVNLHQAISARLSQAVEKAYRIEQLTAANQAYFEMLGFVSHELKSPVASISMDISVLLEGYLGSLSEKQSRKLEKVTRKTEYLLNLIGEYLNLSRLESGQLDSTRFVQSEFISDILEPAVEMVASLIEEKSIRLNTNKTKNNYQIMGAPDLLQIVMVNLLSNAIKYGNEDGEIRIKVWEDGHLLKISVWNEGPGFPETERTRLFQKFARVQTKELLRRRGTGVGLYTTWRIIQTHKGKITADSKQGSWAEFTLELPMS